MCIYFAFWVIIQYGIICLVAKIVPALPLEDLSGQFLCLFDRPQYLHAVSTS